jgi:hypothetical protein
VDCPFPESQPARGPVLVRIRAAHHYPLIVFLLQVILNRHLSRAGAFGRKRNRRVRLVPVELHRSHVDVHGGRRHALGRQIVQHALTHRVIIFDAAMTSGETKNQEED